MGKEVLELLTPKSEKRQVTKSPKPVKVDLSRLHEQLDQLLTHGVLVDLSTVQAELTDVSARLERCEAQLTLIVSMLQSKLDLDVQEQEIMALMRAKIEKG